MSEIKTIDECRDNIQKFANTHKVIFEDKGECGFGRPCVGFLRNDNWVAYNPTSFPDYEYIKEFYDDIFYDIAPPDAYHKHDCLAVLGQGDDSIRQLSDWVDELNRLNISIVQYETGATGFQMIISGVFNYTVKINKNE